MLHFFYTLPKRGIGIVSAAIAFGGLSVGAVPAQAVTSSSYVFHDFVITPGPFSVFVPGWRASAITLAGNSFGERDIDFRSEAGFPSIGGGVAVSSAVTGAFASASASAGWTISGASLIGTAVASTFASATNGPGFGSWAYGFADSAAFGFLGQIGRFGRIEWNQFISIGSTAFSFASVPPVRARDPISFSFNADGIDYSGTLFDSDLTFLSGTGSMVWQNGIVSINTPVDNVTGGSGIIKLDMSSEFVLNPGFLDFEFQNGIVTKSNCSGVFCNIFPAVGQLASGDFELGRINIDYDLGIDGPLDVNWEFSNGSGSTAVPEPSSWAMLILGFGLVGLTIRRRVALA